MQKAVQNITEFQKEIKKTLSAKTTEIIDSLLEGAMALNASDLHLEPAEEETKIRIRVDGILQDVITIEAAVYQALLSRIKLLSGIKMNVTDKPQDGRFSIALPHDAEIRTSTLPAEHGETVVMRILNPKSLIEIEALGLRKDLLALFTKELKKPNGMIIVTGPTGSGKTTTLYAFLKKVQKTEIKIITIEDPIEYHLNGISQTQVNSSKGYDFASGLKSIMRQDPDVILVGEVRDLETAQTALQAALTGHLVFTTLHTNDAAGTIARLISLGADATNIGPAVNVAIAQRLVRKICRHCGKMSKAAPADLKKIKAALKEMPKIAQLPSFIKDIKLPKPQGCKECNSTGFLGRVGIFEAFQVDDEMEKYILTRPSIAALRSMAIKKGMVTMKQDGILKVINGITTLEEVERIVGE
ncbi:MAG: type II/IV secretion system protein [Candidatus Nealsonbacteria bacterium]|nr:type II/IV secretion system protein [Candidatus Nealsonbacteria bacterium]